jgi:hypothetical protein
MGVGVCVVVWMSRAAYVFVVGGVSEGGKGWVEVGVMDGCGRDREGGMGECV